MRTSLYNNFRISYDGKKYAIARYVKLLFIAVFLLSVGANFIWAQSPASIPTSSLSLWLRADAGITSASGVVTSWQDQSPSQHILSQSNASNGPILQNDEISGSPTLRFNGNQFLYSSDLMPCNQDITVVIVSKADNPNGTIQGVDQYAFIMGAADNSRRGSMRGFGYLSGSLFFANWGGGVSIGGDPMTSDPIIIAYTFTRSPAIAQGFMDGSIVGSGSPNTGIITLSEGITVGEMNGPGYFRPLFGTISEIIVYNRILTSEEFQRIGTYLGDKYKLYYPGAIWISGYSSIIQQQITINKWNKAQTDAYTATNPLTITPNGGIFTQSLVTLTPSSSGEAVCYTTDGSDPATSSTSKIYSAPFIAPSNNVVNARAVNQNGSMSAMVSSLPFEIDSQTIFNRYSLLMWYRADYGVSLNGSGHVVNWMDASGNGNGYQATQSNSALAGVLVPSELNGKSVVRFDGNNQFLQLNKSMPDLTGMTIFAVVTPSTGDYGTIFSDSTTSGNNDMYFSLNNTYVIIQADKQGTGLAGGYDGRGGCAASLGLSTSGQSRVITWSMAPSQSNVYREGNLIGAFNLTASEVGYHAANPTIACWWDEGSRERYFNGDIAELLIFNQALSDQERQEVESYLLARYGMDQQVGIPVFSQTSGNYFNSFQLRLSSVTPGALIYYTFDGTEPTTSSILYQGPITVSATATIKAKAFKSGLSNSGTAEESYFIGAPNGTGGLLGNYFTNTTLSGTAVLSRVDPVIDFTWTNTTPDLSTITSSNYYSARWTGYIIPQYSENYTFYTDSDDGVKLVVDGQVLIDQFSVQGETWHSKSISLQSGRYYSIELDYQQQTGSAICRLLWSSPSIPQQIIPQSQLYSGLSYSQTVATPTATPTQGNYTSPINVTLSTPTPGATIVYTTNGSTPTRSSTVYTSSIPISANTTLKAFAYLQGYNDSLTITRTFTFDSSGPALTDLQFNGATLTNGATITTSGTLSVVASDSSGVNHVDFLIDNVLFGTATGITAYTTNFNIASIQDGTHVLTVTSYDLIGNSSTQTVSITVQLAAPSAPSITSPADGSTSGTTPITVTGTTIPNGTVTLYNNGQTLSATVQAAQDGSFQTAVSLGNGINSIQASAHNPDSRGGESPLSAVVSVTLDTAIPQAPTGFQATTLSNGAVQLSWGALPPGSVAGYNVYRANSATGTLTKVNVSLITKAQYTDLPPTDGTYYYVVKAVSTSGIESVVSEQQNAISDRTAPEASSIVYSPQGQYDSLTGRIAPGLVNVVVTVNEPLQAMPFLSITPAGGFPISITLQQDSTSNLRYTGSFVVQATTPSGTATAVLSAVDLAGNRGTKIDAGGTLLLDTAGPEITDLLISPSTAIQNNPSNPAQVIVTFTLNQAVADGTTPTLGYTLSSNPNNALSFSQVVPGVDNLTWIATTVLPSTAGATTENMSLTFRATDDLGNVGTTISAAHQFQVYQGNLPGLAAPFGLSATSQAGGQIQLQWQSVAEASNYQLYRKGPSDSTMQPLAQTGGGLSYLDSTPVDGTYSYAIASVRSLNSQETIGSPSGLVSALADRQPTNPPQNLTGTLSGYGVTLQWQAPASLSEPVTYLIYRSSTSIASLTGLTPISSGNTLQAVDASPNPAQPYYAVVTQDAAGNLSAPSNSIYQDVQLLPVSTLTVFQSDNNAPIVTWSSVSGNIAGYNIFLGSQNALQQLNSGGPATATIYTDNEYTGDERSYTIFTVDNNNQSSPGHSITLPKATATLDPNSVVQIGLVNDLNYTVTNSSSQALTGVSLRVSLGGKDQVVPCPDLQPGQSQPVTVVVGGYSNLTTGTAPITTTIEIVPHAGEKISIQRLGTVQVAQNGLTASLFPSGFTRNGNGNVQFSLTNPSTEDIQILVAQNNGTSPSSQVRLKLVDANGTVYSTTPVQFNVGANVVTLSNGDTVLDVPGGSTVTTPVQLVPVPNNVPDNMYVQLEIDHVYYARGQTGKEVELQGLTTRQSVSVVATSYYGRVMTVSPSVSNGNSPIAIAGAATFSATNTAAPNQGLVLHIANGGFERTFQIATQSDGTFSYTFIPSEGEPGGIYSVWATNPAITDRTPQQTFTIQRISVTPTTINLTAPRNYAQTLTYTAQAGPGTSAANLHFELVSADQPNGQLPAGITVNTSSGVIASLAQNSSASMPISITGNSSVSTGALVLRLRSDNDGGQPWQKVIVNYVFGDAVAALQWSNYSTTTGVNPGKSVTVNLTLQNLGLTAANNVTLHLLNQDGTAAPGWVMLGVSASVSQVNVGDQVPVSITFSPGSNQAQGNYAFIVRASGDNQANQDAVVALTITNSGKGNAMFHAVDIYTGTADAQNHPIRGLSGASITLTNVDVPTITATQTTDSDGSASFVDLTVGQYQYRASSSGHSDSTGVIWIQPGATTVQEVALQNQTVNVTWQVVPTTIQDRYDITINATFQTQIPAPVVVAEPTVTNLPQLNSGDIYNGQIKFTNYGLIAVDNVKFSLPASDANLKYELLGTVPSTLGAGESITLAYRITCIQSFPKVQTAMLGGAGASMLAGIGLIAIGSRRRRWLLLQWGCGAVIVGISVGSVFVPKKLWAASSDCYSYQSGTSLKGCYKCTNGNLFNLETPVYWSYIINDCPAIANGPSQTDVQKSEGSSSGNASGGGTIVSPAPAPSGGKDCFPKVPEDCDGKEQTQSSISLTQREYRDEATDLTVKIIGGRASISRYYYYNAWQWRNLMEGLTFNSGGGGISSIDYITEHYIAIDAALTTYEQSVTHAKITATSTGYRWQSKEGEWKTFDTTGKMLATGNRNLTLTQLQYDASGNLTRVVDANGNTIFTITLSNGKITQIQDIAGRIVKYGYSGNNLTSVTDPLNRSMSYSYNTNGLLTSKTDFNGNTFTVTYDAGGYVTSEVDSKGNGWFFTFSYDPSLQQFYSQTKTSGGLVKEKTFGNDGLLLQDKIGGISQRKVIRDGTKLHITESNGASVEQDFDEFGNLTREVRPEGETSYQYELKYHQPTQITYPDGTITEMTYDANGNLKTKTEAKGTLVERTTLYDYDSYNQLQEKTDPRGNKAHYIYNDNGNLLREYDPANPARQATYTYDAVGNRLTQADALNATTTYAYDALGRVTTVTNALGEQTITTYQGDWVQQIEVGRTATHTGRITQYTYDQQARTTQIIRVGNSGSQVQETITYDADGRVVADTNALGQSTTYQYDNFGRKTAVTTPLGSGGSTRFVIYDNAGNVLTEKDPVGWLTSYTYDASNRMATKTEAVGQPEQRTTSYAYDSRNRITTITYSDGTNVLSTHYGYDALGRKTNISGQREYPMTIVYDGNGNVMSQTDARNNTTTYQYDAYNNRTQINAPGQVAKYAYDLNGNLVSITDGNNVVRGYAYDALNRKIAESVPTQGLGSGWVSVPAQVLQGRTYNSWGETVATQDATGGTMSATYDDFGRRTATTDAAGLTLTYSYSALDKVTRINYPSVGDVTQGTSIQYIYDSGNGNLVRTVMDRAGNTTSYDYDLRFLKTKETASNGAITQYSYDPLGRLSQQVDDMGNTTVQWYDQFDQLVEMAYPDSTPQTPRVARYSYDAWGKLLTQGGTGQYPVTYSYDETGNRASLTDGNGSKTQWTYDALNRVSTKTYVDGSSYQYTYDGAGNLATRRDALGRVTQYGYNAFNKVASITYPSDPAVSFQYDALGRRTQMQDGSGTTYWEWNSAGQNTGYTQGAMGQSVGYEYDSEGHRTQMAVGATGNTAAWDTRYAYDPAGRLSTMADSQVSTTAPFTYAYQPGTNWIAGHTNPDGSGALNQYDVLGRLIRTTAANTAGSAINTYAYTYDAAGQRTQEASTNGTRRFSYDDQRQLTDAVNVDGNNQPVPHSEYGYQYDAIGNRMQITSAAGQITFTVNALNQYTAISSVAQPPQYDANGNLTADGQGNTYVYDQENRLVEVDTPGNNPIVKTVHVYDGLSRRVEKRTYGSGNALLSTTRYLYDGLLPIAEYDASNVLQRSYTRGLDIKGTMQDAGGIGGLLAMTNSGGANYSYFYDGNGNVVDLTAADGSLAAHYQYDSFGNLVVSTGSLQQPYQWSTKETDAGTGLVYYLYRFYNPSLGRWLSRDPIGENGGLNLYGYVTNNPVNLLDSLGLDGGTWKFYLEGASNWYDYEPPSIQASYTWSADDKKCCNSFHIQRYATKWPLYNNDVDGPPGDDDVNGTAYSTPDQPGWLHGHFNLPFTATFTWKAICTSGKSKGRVLSSATKVYKNNWGKPSLTDSSK